MHMLWYNRCAQPMNVEKQKGPITSLQKLSKKDVPWSVA